jgi:hypothetical protein
LHLVGGNPSLRLEGTSGIGGYHTIAPDGANDYIMQFDADAGGSNGQYRFAVSGTDALTIDSSGNVGIGTSSPSVRLDIVADSSGNNFRAARGAGSLLESFQSTTGANYLYTSGSNAALIFGTGTTVGSASERMRLDSSGNLLVGKSGAGTNTEGAQFDSNGRGNFTVDANFGLLVNRKTSDGELARFQKDGTTVGSIGTESGNLVIGFGNSGIKFGSGASAIVPHSLTTGADVDASIDLGTVAGSTRRFKDLYLSGGVYLGGTGAANLLDDYEEGTWTPVYEGSTTNPTVDTYDGQRGGHYRKVGSLVTVIGRIRTDSISSVGAGNLKIGGLPFSINNQEYPTASLTNANAFVTNQPLSGYGDKNSTTIQLMYRSSVNGDDQLMTVSELDTGGNANDVIFTMSYLTDA